MAGTAVQRIVRKRCAVLSSSQRKRSPAPLSVPTSSKKKSSTSERRRPVPCRGVAALDAQVVVASELRKVYGSGETEVVALDGVSTAFERDRFTAIMGPSGSGKSTLMHILAGLDTPTSGTVTLDGVDITHLDDGELTKLRRDKLGFVFQFFNLLPVLTAEENLVLPLSIAGRKPDKEWVDQLIRTVGLEERRTHRPSELSGGQQQRVAVARALVSKPAVVFADEPTGNLDSKASADVLDLLRRAVDEFRQTVVMVTHDPVAAAHADRLITLRDGKVVQDGAPGGADDVIELLKQLD
ncbi:MAG: ABC transporter ATP-binding protein [Actinobacteria bacterium]|nr:ABC transporter ATP-binding protein [Actinomycetota bacterium]